MLDFNFFVLLVQLSSFNQLKQNYKGPSHLLKVAVEIVCWMFVLNSFWDPEMSQVVEIFSHESHGSIKQTMHRNKPNITYLLTLNKHMVNIQFLLQT